MSNSKPNKAVAPRISVMIAIDTDGDIFYALTQVNTDSTMKKLLLSSLCKQLDEDRPDWRETTVMIMDNAKYNRSAECIEHIKYLKIPMVFTGAYSYDISPVERFFSYVKQGMVIEFDTPSGKR